jgi:hypothetical protein
VNLVRFQAVERGCAPAIGVQIAKKRGVKLPEVFEQGEIVGSVRLDDCVTHGRLDGLAS